MGGAPCAPISSRRAPAERARFDRVLAQCAREAGARFLERATVKEPIVDDDRVTGVRYSLDGQPMAAQAPYVIDVSGRGERWRRHSGSGSRTRAAGWWPSSGT
jgi:flavin-dependent dehydrogenase